MKKLILLLCTFLFLVGCGTKMETFESTNLDITLDYPADWQVIEGDDNLTITNVEGLNSLADLGSVDGSMEGTIIGILAKQMNPDEREFSMELSGIPARDYSKAMVELYFTQIQSSLDFNAIQEFDISGWDAAIGANDAMLDEQLLRANVAYVYNEISEQELMIIAFDSTREEDELVRNVINSIEFPDEAPDEDEKEETKEALSKENENE